MLADDYPLTYGCDYWHLVPKKTRMGKKVLDRNFHLVDFQVRNAGDQTRFIVCAESFTLKPKAKNCSGSLKLAMCVG